MKTLIRFDWAIKKLLRSKANFVILEGFLSELLKQNVKIVQLLDSESNRNNEEDKQNQVDILAQLTSGELVLIEVQVRSEYDYFHRMIYGTSKIITDFLHKGQPYREIKKVYSVNILYFELGQGKDYIYHGTTRFIGLHQHDEIALSVKQQKIFQKGKPHELFPEYYLINVNQFNDVAKNTLDQWIYFLKNEEIQDNFNAKGLLKAKDELSILKLSSQEKSDYESYLKNLRYQNSMTRSDYDSGLVDGKEKGEKIGMEKGEKIGSTKEKLAIARNLKKLGATLDLIQQATGLSKQEIEKLI